MSTRENILAAFATALAGVAGGRIYRERREQIAASGLPAVLIEPRSELIVEDVIGKADHRLFTASPRCPVPTRRRPWVV